MYEDMYGKEAKHLQKQVAPAAGKPSYMVKSKLNQTHQSSSQSPHRKGQSHQGSGGFKSKRSGGGGNDRDQTKKPFTSGKPASAKKSEPEVDPVCQPVPILKILLHVHLPFFFFANFH